LPFLLICMADVAPVPLSVSEGPDISAPAGAGSINAGFAFSAAVAMAPPPDGGMFGILNRHRNL
jgi:hypothetical protein